MGGPVSDVSLVVTDLDGTLWHTPDEMRPEVTSAVAELAGRGMALLVATGRRRASARAALAAVGLAPPAVLLNGALGLDLATGERFHRAPYPPDEAAAVLAAFAGLDLSPVVHVDHPEVDSFLGPRPSTHPDHAASILTSGRVADLDVVVAEHPVLGFSLIGVDHAIGVAARDGVGPIAETHLDRSLDFPGTVTFTVAPHGQSKWDGVLAFCARHDLDPDRVLALGDGANDGELLDGAAIALVPAAAHPSALDRADHVIPAAVDGGWTAVLDFV